MKQMLVVAIMGVAFAIYAGYNGIHVPHKREARLIQTQVAEEQTRQQTVAEVAVLLQQVERHRKRLPQEPDPSWLVKEIVALARESGLPLASISQDAPQRLEGFTRLAVSLQCDASYHQLGTFLDDVERSNWFIRVDHIQIGRAKRDGTAPIQLTLSTLYVPPRQGGG